MRKNFYNNYKPNPDQMALFPKISGNTINGLGEREVRNPDYVYWGNDPNDIHHGDLQKWFYTVDPGLKEYDTIRKERTKILQKPLTKTKKTKTNFKIDKINKFFSKSIEKKVFDKVGVTKFNPIWSFKGIKISYKNIVILGFQHNYENIKKSPEPEGGLEVMRQYKRAAYGAKYFANWLRKNGWEAEPLTGPMSGKITMIPPAIEAGFGELGKHGSIINPEFGSSFRLSAILTDCPLPYSKKQSHEVDEFCLNCKICENECPPGAIFNEKKTVRGIKKWYVDFDKCLPFFNEHQGCGICIAVCPWSRPGVGFNLVNKLMKRKKRKHSS